MKTKEIIVEAKEKPVVPPTRVTSQELVKLLGKARTKALVTNTWFTKYSNWEKAYRFHRDKYGFITVDVFPYFKQIHTTTNGTIRPIIYLAFKFYTGTKVGQVDQFKRDKEPNELEKRWPASGGWDHYDSWTDGKEVTEGKENITEGATDVLYHYTNIRAAMDILRSGNFMLSRSTGNRSEEEYAPPGYDYFLSLTRSKVGDYHRYIGYGAVMFVLDGQWLQQRYPVKPIDYWNRSWLHAPDRTREAEDRVFSKTPEISAKCVRAIHALIKEQHEWGSPAFRMLALLAKKNNIPIFLYDDAKAWQLQDTRRSKTVKQMGDKIQGVMPTRTMYRPPTDYLEPWLELLYKKNKADLSPEAEKLRYNLRYYDRYGEDNGFGNALSNERKPGSTGYDTATKLIKAMRQMKLSDPLELKKAISAKWNKIADDELAAKRAAKEKSQPPATS